MSWLDQRAWDAVQASVPIVCVDLVLVRGGSIGLIRRPMPPADRQVWCLIGGRVAHGETLRQAMLRHLRETLSGVEVSLPADPQPDNVFQWFPSERGDEGVAYGLDPRRHSVGLCFVLPAAGEPVVVEGGEGTEFTWWPVADLELLRAEAWPGTVDAARAALGG